MNFRFMPTRVINWMKTLSGCNLFAAGFFSVFLLISCSYLLRPVSDPDFFWHLRTGEWIWQHGQLPDYDPFTFTGPQHPSPQQSLILRGYAGAQLVYYGLFEILGWPGIFFLRFVLAAVLLAALWLRFASAGRTSRSLPLELGLLLLFSVLFFERFPVDRPQVFSFACFGILLLLYERLRAEEGQLSMRLAPNLAIFVLMLIWGNAHPGYLVGVAFLGCAGLLEGVLCLFAGGDRQRLARVIRFVGAGTLGAIGNATTINWDLIVSLAGKDSAKKHIYNNEYQSVFEYYKIFSDNIMIIYAVFIIISLLFLFVKIKKTDVVEVVLLVFFGAYAFLYVRYIPFFVIMAMPLLYKHLVEIRARSFRNGFLLVCFAFFICYAQDEVDNVGLLRNNGAVTTKMPGGAADYLIKNKPSGNILNAFEWGGYLLWRLSPETKIYQDSRVLNEQVFLDWLSCLVNMKGASGGQLWQEIFAKYAIDLAVLPKFSKKGLDVPHELSYQLAADANWQVLYHDDVSIVFSRKSPFRKRGA